MEDKELDRILKSKLDQKITMSPEMENRIKAKIEEQKNLRRKTIKPKRNYTMLKMLLPVAAVVLIVFTVGLNFQKEVIENRNNSIAVIKSVEPTKLYSGILANDSEFIIQAEENSTKESVQRSIYIEPALDYTIEKTGNKDEYKIKFKQNIPDNIILKLQYVKDEITQDSWAYQTSNKLSVTSVYPNNRTDEALSDTIIEIEFSYSNIENFEDNVSIEPNIEGKWEHLGRVWRFIPEKELETQKYTINIKNGITAGEEKLENDYSFSFTVVNKEENGRCEYNFYTIDGISTYKPNERVRIYYKTDYEVVADINKIEISKFKTVDDFIVYLDSGKKDNTTNSKEYEFTENTEEKYLELNESLKEGYYVASVKNSKGKEAFNCPIQINNVSAYVMESERDVIAWVADDDGLAKNVSVEYQGKEIKTNSDGIAIFEGISDGSKTFKYAKIGNGENKLIVGLYNYNFDNYPRSYIYTDRPVYKNTDTVKIWGFVPRKLFFDEIEDEFYIGLSNEGKQKVKIEEDGNFNYEINLKNHFDDEYCALFLYYKDYTIAHRSIEIKNYELQNYNYEIISEKNYTQIGETYEFDVRVKHITGLSVPNKALTVRFDGETYRGVTTEEGIAHFSIYIKEDPDYDYRYMYSKEIDVYSGEIEEIFSSADAYQTLYIIRGNVKPIVSENLDKTYEVKLQKLDLDKNTNITYTMEEIYDGIYDTSINVNLIENISERTISYYEIDEYAKENRPVYYWNDSRNTTKIATVDTKKGIAKIDVSDIKLKASTDDINYSYCIEFEFEDSNGNLIKDQNNIYSMYNYKGGKVGYFNWGSEESDDEIYIIPKDINDFYYYSYRYFFDIEKFRFSIGDTQKFKLYESLIDEDKNIKNEGKILRISFKENIYKTEIIDDDNFDYKFTEDDFPGCKMATAYYYEGRFYRMPEKYCDFKSEDRKIDIEVKADKEKYAPGDEVTLKIKTSNNGKPIKCFVNVSVANEAIREFERDWNNIEEVIYSNKDYPVYTYSSNADYLNAAEGGGGGGGEPRGKFADTAHFETVYTNKSGEAEVKFKLPDNVTSYRVTTHAANEDMYVGVNTVSLVSTLDFFIQSIEPRSIKVTDDLVLNATSVSTDKFDVDYEFTIKELNKTLTTTAPSNSMATVNFGNLDYGKYHVVIKGSHGDSEDSIEYEINIIETAQEIKEKTTVAINDDSKIYPTKNPICLEIYNKGMEQYLKYVDFIERTKTLRLDTQIAYNKIIELKNKYYQTNDSVEYIELYEYKDSSGYRNLPNAKTDMALTAFIKYYAKDYEEAYYTEDYLKELLRENYNLYEVYLLASAREEKVLNDLLYLKEDEEIDNYNKLLLTLSFEFLGDYKNARDLYNTLDLSEEEKNEYKSLVAMIETFINKEEAVKKINEMIEENPTDEYLRFAILSFFKNSSEDLNKEEKVEVVCGNNVEEINLKGMQVKTYFINNEDLNNISFNTESEDLLVSYYYQTSLENAKKEYFEKDIKIDIDGELVKGNEVVLKLDFDSKEACDVKISLPNSLRLVYKYEPDFEKRSYYVKNNNIDYIIVQKLKDYKHIEIPLLVLYEGDYKFESVVAQYNDLYHISNSLDLSIK